MAGSRQTDSDPSGLVFEDPPPTASRSVSTWLTVLREQPGRWAARGYANQNAANSSACRIRKTHPEFECTTRGNKLYVRFMPKAQPQRRGKVSR